MLLFEAMVVELAKSQPVRTCGAGRRARHPPVAVRQTLRGRGTPVRGLHGRAGDRHRRDRPQRPQLHHCGRRPGGAQRGPRGAGQGRAYRRTVRAGFHGPQRRPKPGGSGDVRHEPGIRQRHLRTLAQRREGHRQVPHRQARQRGRRQGSQGRGRAQHEIPVSAQRNKPTRTPIGDQAQPAEASAQDR